MLSDASVREIKEIRGKYPDPKSAILPSLYIAIRESGWLSHEVLRCVAETLNLPPALVRGTASFYSLFRSSPTGRHLIQLCTNVSCMLLGAEKVKDVFRNRFGLEPGGTSEDRRFTLMIVECIGACDGAPSMLINDDSYDNLTEQKITEILKKYE
jgi:NADH-quinone oxidoreductase E subunit